MSKEETDATRRRDLDAMGDSLRELDAEARDREDEEDDALDEDGGLVREMQNDASLVRTCKALTAQRKGTTPERGRHAYRRRFTNAHARTPTIAVLHGMQPVPRNPTTS